MLKDLVVTYLRVKVHLTTQMALYLKLVESSLHIWVDDRFTKWVLAEATLYCCSVIETRATRPLIAHSALNRLLSDIFTLIAGDLLFELGLVLNICAKL